MHLLSGPLQRGRWPLPWPISLILLGNKASLLLPILSSGEEVPWKWGAIPFASPSAWSLSTETAPHLCCPVLLTVSFPQCSHSMGLCTWLCWFFSHSGTRSQITTCSLHMFSIVRETQTSHFTFFILNSYGSFGTLSRRTPRRRSSPTHRLLASSVGVYGNLEWWGWQGWAYYVTNTKSCPVIQAINRRF